MPDSTTIGPRIVQIGLVVADIEATAAHYCDVFDLPMPEVFVADGNPPATYRHESVPAGLRGIAFDLGEVQIEFLQPTDAPSAWSDFLAANGSGVHHVAFAVADTEAAVRSFSRHGYSVLQQGEFSNGEGMYTYLDTDTDLGVVIELMQRYVVSQPAEKSASEGRGFGTQAVVQVAIVVSDIEATKARYSQVFALPAPPTIDPSEPEVTETIFHGRPSKATAKLAFFDFGQLQLELIEPDASPSVWREHLDARGQSVHHIAFSVGDSDRAVDYFEERGMVVTQHGLYGDRSGRYTYLDTSNQMAVDLELLESFPEPR